LINKLKTRYFDSLSTGKREISKNIGFSFVAKGLSLLVTFITVPLLLSYLGKDTYGIWLTIFSVISWMSFFDLGLGNGLRNHLTHIFTEKNDKKAQQYISTAYWLLGGVIIICICTLQFGVYFVDWIKVFRPVVQVNVNFNTIVSICLWGFGLLLITRLIVSILQSTKHTGVGDLLMSIGSFASLVLIFIISNFELQTKLFAVAYVFSWVTPIVLLLFSLYYFGIKKKNLRPRFKDINKTLAKNIFGLGIEFFLAQFLVLVLNQSSNIIITQILSPADVTVYYIPLRLFSVFSIIMGLVSTNLLPYITEASAKNDLLRMKKIVNKFYKLLALLVIVFSLILIFSESIIRVWTANQIKIPFQLLGLHFVLVIIMGFNSIFSTVLNGIGKIRAQLPVFLFAAVLFIPLGILMGKKYGLSGLVIATIISQIPICVFFFLQTKKHINYMEAKK
jgi:O-antigen/teichoic acid export membrane protein